MVDCNNKGNPVFVRVCLGGMSLVHVEGMGRRIVDRFYLDLSLLSLEIYVELSEPNTFCYDRHIDLIRR